MVWLPGGLAAAGEGAGERVGEETLHPAIRLLVEVVRARCSVSILGTISRLRCVVPVDYCFWVVSLFRIERIREQFEKDSRKGGKRESKRARTFGFCFCFSAPTPIPSTTWEEQRNQRFRCDLLSLIRKRKVPRARRRSDLARRIQKEKKVDRS